MKLATVPGRERKSCSEGDCLIDPVPAGSPMQTAQLIGALVIRFVQFAQEGLSFSCFPDSRLLEAILRNARDREAMEAHIVQLLYHHSKILDLVGTPQKNIKRLCEEAFPHKKIESPKWEIV